nr:protein SPIRAL1-like 3 [Ipomoea batatas]GMC95104.1 protein SPIRAL1-like 3 [Ipomoea batatas]
MGRGVSAGGGQSSLGYLFGGGEAPNKPQPAQNPEKVSNDAPAPKPAAAAAPPSQPADVSKQVPAGILSSNANNYTRADGQNCGNFLTERRSTKVQAAPGGGSSLGYLFGGDGK